MTSMTGYGRAEQQSERAHVVVEIKTVNNRYLDLNTTLPGSVGALELQIREKISAACSRGRVDVFVRYREMEENLQVTVDRQVLGAYLESLQVLREAAGISDPVTMDHLLQRDGILKTDRSVDPDDVWRQIEPVFDQALADCVASRMSEGQRLERDIRAQVDQVGEALDAIRTHEEEIETQVRSNLRDRFRDVVGDAVEETRMLAEIAVQLTRFSIHEEVVRLGGHLESFYATLDSDEPSGKALDFRCQEMHREVNTIGSKSVVQSISECVIQAKQAIENVREQLRNVE